MKFREVTNNANRKQLPLPAEETHWLHVYFSAAQQRRFLLTQRVSALLLSTSISDCGERQLCMYCCFPADVPSPIFSLRRRRRRRVLYTVVISQLER